MSFRAGAVTISFRAVAVSSDAVDEDVSSQLDYVVGWIIKVLLLCANVL